MKKFLIYLFLFFIAFAVSNALGRMYVYTLSDIHQTTLILWGIMILMRKGVEDEL